MARSPVEIEADIAVARRHIEAQLDHFERRFTQCGLTLMLVGSAFVAGVVLSRLPVARLLPFAVRVVRAAATVAGAIAALSGMAASLERVHTTQRGLRAA